MRLRPDHKLAMVREMELPARVKAARGMLDALVRVAEQVKAA